MFNVNSRKVNPQNLENHLNQLTCIYRNESETIQIVRISHPNIAFFEKSVFPNQCLQFSATGDALLEVYDSSICGLVQDDTIPCRQLAITTGIDRNQNLTIAKDSLQDVIAAAA
jgi:hypothetical protein